MQDVRALTAFGATARALRAAFADVTLDAASLRRPLAPCVLDRCGGTCCSEGATLNAEEAMVLRQVCERSADRLRALRPGLPERPVVEEDGVQRTARLPRRMHGRIEDYPAHFADTACAFLMEDGRCALQCLAEQEGRHPWSYKPLACWLHPLSLTPDAIILPDTDSDPHPGGFASATHCGRAAACGAPAHRVLQSELEHLGALLGRDLLAELDAADQRP